MVRTAAIGLIRLRLWSPEQIAHSLREWGVANAPCPATIYRHVHDDRARGGKLFQCLRHGCKRRRRPVDAQYLGVIPDRVGIERRPSVVDAKSRVGDYEADLIVGAGHKGAILVLLERRTGKLFAAPLRNKKAHTVARAVVRLLRPCRERVHTITFDNGREFSQHRRISRALDCECYFTNPYSSWEKGGVENANGLLRQYFPKKMRLDRVGKADVDAAIKELNERPRKRLGWNTPDQAFLSEMNAPPQGELWYKPIEGGCCTRN